MSHKANFSKDTIAGAISIVDEHKFVPVDSSDNYAFNMDGTERDLDLSAEVPTNAVAILFSMNIRSTSTNQIFYMKPKGNTNWTFEYNHPIANMITRWSGLVIANGQDSKLTYDEDANYNYGILKVHGYWE